MRKWLAKLACEILFEGLKEVGKGALKAKLWQWVDRITKPAVTVTQPKV